MKRQYLFAFTILIILGLTLAACQAEPETIYVTEIVEKEVEIEGETVVVTEIVEVEVEVTEETLVPDTLVICIGQDPTTLYPYGGSMLAEAQLQQAVFDGPIDSRSFAYQPVILEKLPSLADGDAVINSITVSEGDTVALGGSPADLQVGDMIRPPGCRTTECEVEYEGGEVEMDQMEVTFKMVPDLVFSDGEPLTAADSVYTFNLVADPDTPASKYTNDRTASYEAIDDVTVVWKGLPGYIDASYYINFWPPYPEHLWGEFTALELLTEDVSSQRPVGWGPYVIDEWVTGEAIYLSKNPYYFRADEGLPKFDNVIFRIIGENSAANIAALLAGECDVVDQTSHLDDENELILELQNSGQIAATFMTGTVWEHADFGITHVSYDDGFDINEDRPQYFSDVRTRKAIAMCMDRQAVVDTVMFGQSIVLDTYVPPQHPLFNPDVMHYEYDPEAGMALLEEVGWTDTDGDGIREAYGIEGVPDGTLLEFGYWTTNATQRQQATQILAENLAGCGVNVELEYWASGFFDDGPTGPLFGRLFDMGQFAWLSGVEPPCDYFISEQLPSEEYGWGSANDVGYLNPDYDVVCNAALSALPGEDAYVENHLLAQEIFADELPNIPLYLRLKLAATRTDFCGFVMDPTENSEMWNIEEFGYGPLCDE